MRHSSDEGEIVHTNSFDLRLMGADLMAPSAGADDIIRSASFTVDPVRYTTSEGYHLGKTLPFIGCRDMINRYPSQFLLVSLPGFGTPQGGRHSCAILRNVSELIVYASRIPPGPGLGVGDQGTAEWERLARKTKMSSNIGIAHFKKIAQIALALPLCSENSSQKKRRSHRT